MGGRKSKLPTSVTELTDNQVAEICRRTNLVDFEVRRRYSAFCEQYPSGIITREQLDESLREIWPETRIDKFATYLFAILDQNQNGTIDFIEFINTTYKLETNNTFQQNDDHKVFLGLLFDMFDRNRNGYLEKHELKPLVESLYDLSGVPNKKRRGIYSSDSQVKYLLNKLDKDQDKRLSRQEFITDEKWTHDDRLSRFFLNYYDIYHQQV